MPATTDEGRSRSSVPAFGEDVDLRRLRWVGPLVIVAAIAANLLIRAIALAAFDISDDFEPLASVGPVIVSTVVGVGAAIGVFALIARRSARPIPRFRIVALGALAVSFLGFLSLRGTDGFGPAPAWTLATMHVVTFLICVGLLTTLTRRSP